jgi:hypothetical protein
LGRERDTGGMVIMFFEWIMWLEGGDKMSGVHYMLKVIQEPERVYYERV